MNIATVGGTSGAGTTGGTQNANLGPINIDGLVSGFNTTQIINQLVSVESQPLTHLDAKKSDLTSKLTAYQQIAASLQAAASAASALTDPTQFMPRTVSVSTPADAAASATDLAQLGTHSLVVKNLAQAQEISSATQASATTALGLSGSLRINGKTVNVAATDTLTDLVNKINSAGTGVTAGILTVSSSDYRLTLTAGQSGAGNSIDLADANGSGILRQLGLTDGTATVKHAVTGGVQSDGLSASGTPVATALGLSAGPTGTIQINGTGVSVDLGQDSLQTIAQKINSQVSGVTASVVSQQTNGQTTYSLQIVGASATPTVQDSGNVLETLGVVHQGVANPMQAAKDATVVLDGVTINRPTNSFDGVITGLNLELTQADPTNTLTLTVAPDVNTVVNNVQAFVQAYNNVSAAIDKDESYDSTSGTGGVLFGDQAMLQLAESMRRAVTGLVNTAGGGQAVSSAGLTTDANDNLVLDTSKLTSALNRDPDAVAKLFGLTGAAGSSQLTYIASGSRTADSGANGYAVNVTAPATEATATSADLSGGITRTETLTFNHLHDVTLTSGMSLDQARDSLNSWFQTYGLNLTASDSGGKLQIQGSQYGSAYGFTLSSNVARGAGGTDLGGVQSGQAVSYAGTDVQGTIGGEAATGSGQVLTGNSSDLHAASLAVRVTAPGAGNAGTVTVTKGLAQRFADLVANVTDSNHGALTDGENSINANITDINSQEQTIQTDVQTYTAQLRQKFTDMETALGKAQVLQQYISGQITQMQNTVTGGGSSTGG